jgi:hypothetical protein
MKICLKICNMCKKKCLPCWENPTICEYCALEIYPKHNKIPKSMGTNTYNGG